jgi:hypothetical protein
MKLIKVRVRLRFLWVFIVQNPSKVTADDEKRWQGLTWSAQCTLAKVYCILKITLASCYDPVLLENRIRLLACGLVVASGGVRVFVDQAVEDGFSVDLPDAGVGDSGPRSIASGIGDALGDALVRPGGVVVNLVLG